MTIRARMAIVAIIAIGAMVSLIAVDAQKDWASYRSVAGDTVSYLTGGSKSLPLYTRAQAERRAAAVYLADPTAANRATLGNRRAATDKGVATFRELSVSDLASASSRKAADHIDRILDQLDQVRRQTGARSRDPGQVTDYYTELLAGLVRFFETITEREDRELRQWSDPLIGLYLDGENLSLQDTLIAQARAAGYMTAEQRTAFAEAYGGQRLVQDRLVAPKLAPDGRKDYDRITGSKAWHTTELVAQSVINAPGNSQGVIEDLPPEVEQWDAPFAQAYQDRTDLAFRHIGRFLDASDQRIGEIRSQLLWQLGGGLVAILVIALLIVGVIRSINRQLKALTASAEYSAERLPEVVRLLRDGHEVDAEAEFPYPAEGRVEFARVHRALAFSQHVAVEIARAQAADRRGFGGFVAATSGRALNLVEVQLHLLDELERKHGSTAGLLSDLIGVDQKAVAARRHLDNLMTLAGADKQPYTMPKPLADLVHDAAAETYQPARVSNRAHTQVLVRPEAVNGLIHVLAALLDNALLFSSDEVRIYSRNPVHGTALEIEDMGTGMPEEQYEEANALLAEAPTFETVARKPDGRLGLFVVSQLAQRLGLRIQLRPSGYGGTTAVVLIPHSLHLSPDEVMPPAPTPALTSGTATLPRRPLAGQLAGPDTPSTQLTSPDTPSTQEAPRPADDTDDDPPDPVPEETPQESADAVPEEATGDAPLLPQRHPGTHMASLLTTGADLEADTCAPATDEVPEQVGASWTAYQEGTRAADNRSTPVQKDAMR